MSCLTRIRVHVPVRESVAILSKPEASPTTIFVSTLIDITRQFSEGVMLLSLVRHLDQGRPTLWIKPSLLSVASQFGSVDFVS
ncbi:hypothetical protein EUGRSUZ_I01573 [Eucalyptus grandis]|uniref:Uncharacterized protein n=2 Tax=Eucalyptus grandis TaxID=71139 RepID=A0ACC3JGD0_EUCGR|nr:hypothetical protein EUGRSUZ_I01573 [Eucalyptus grandis]